MSSLDEHARAGMAAIQDQRYDDAVTAFRAALELAPDRPDMNHALAMAYLHRGDVGNAVPHLERAVELAEPYDRPEHQELKRDFHLSLATAYHLLDRIPESRAVLERVVARWPDHAPSRLQLGAMLLSSCQLEDGLAVYEAALDLLDREEREAGEALIGATRAFLGEGHGGALFLRAHADSYRDYFDEVQAQVGDTWYAEAARMARGDDGEARPIVADGARPYALSRVDLVNTADGSISSVYTEQEPMIVQLHGFEPLAQVPVMLPWEGRPFEVWVCSRSPWHWLAITIQLEEPTSPEERIERVDERIGSWYLAGYNGEFGEADKGRFHFVSDPEPVGDRSLSYMVDLGRAGFVAVENLLDRIEDLHAEHPVRRVLFGYARLPD